MRNRRTKSDLPTRVHVEPLEPRVLYSADLWPGDVAAGIDTDPLPELPGFNKDPGDLSLSTGAASRASVGGQDVVDAEALESALLPENESNPDRPLILLVVDSAVEDQDLLLAGIMSDPDVQTELLLLAPDLDGIKQITDALSTLSNVSAIHIVSHGTDGEVELGASRLNTETIGHYESQLSSWSDSLTGDADLLFYGCDVAATQTGTALLDSLATLCQCDVAASNDLTSSKSLGGDWVLEYQVGDVQSDVIISQTAQLLWASTLDITTGLVGHWTFDGDVVDASTTDNDGVFYNESYAGAADGISVVGQYTYTESGARYVEIADSASYDFASNQFSVSFWYQPTDTPDVAQRSIVFQQFDGAVGNEIYLDSNGNINWHISDGLNNYTGNVNGVVDGDWHLISVTRDADDLSIYVDSVLQNSAVASSIGPVNPATPVTLGAGAAGAESYHGLQDDVRLYDKALSQTDIQSLYTTTTPPDPTQIGYTVSIDTFQDHAVSDLAFGDTSSLSALFLNPGADGQISLREAVVAANNSVAADIIELPAGDYELSVAGSGESLAHTGDLDISTDITIRGSGADTTSITGAMSDRLFDVSPTGSLTLEKLTAQGGNSGSYGGAGVNNAGTLNATDVNLLSNIVSNNEGGAIASSGVTNLERVSLVGNSANNGGAIDVSAGTTTLTNVTVTGNSSTYDGGGLRSQGSGLLDVRFSTIAMNEALNGKGGGLASLSGTLALSSSIVGDNQSRYNGQDIFGAISSDGNNVVEDPLSAVGLVASDTAGQDAGLAGRSVDPVSGQHIHAITATSPAYNKISPGLVAEDQRGQDRTGLLDAGAFEVTSTSVVPSDLSSGIELNSDGGNDTFLMMEDANAIFGGLNQITVEHQLAFSDTGPQFLFTYHTTGFTDALQFEFINDGLRLTIADTVTDFTGYDYAGVLGDLQRHTIAFTWNSVGGDVSIYIDGIITETAVGVATGLSIDSDLAGAGFLGLDTDNGGAVFNSSKSFRGTHYDMRIWNDVRSDVELAIGAVAKINVTDIPAGLIVDWQFDQLSGSASNEVVDINSNNNLIVGHASGAGFTASVPRTDLNINENSPVGEVVGYVMPHVASQGAGVTYDSTTNKFYQVYSNYLTWPQAQAAAIAATLNGVPGQLPTVHSQYENDLILQLVGGGNRTWLGASDITTDGEWHWLDGTADADPFWTGGITGLSQNGSYTNWAVNEPSNFNNAEHVAEIWQDGFWNDIEASSDMHVTLVEWDAAEVFGGYTYSLSDNAGGRFSIDSRTGQITVADSTLLNYEAAISHDITVVISDNEGSSYQEVFAVAINPINESPTILTGTNATVVEGGLLTLDSSLITASDPDDSGAGLVYQVTLPPQNGQLELTTNIGNVVTGFTQSDIENSRLIYRHSGSQLATDLIEIQLSDGGEDGAVSSNGSLAIDVLPVNDPPQITIADYKVSPFINEIHYDNFSVDQNEAIEIAGSAGTDLSGWSIVHYNGSTGLRVGTQTLSGSLPDDGSGFGTVVVNYPKNGLQNGPDDGVALVDSLGNVVQILSWDGTFTALDGIAVGMTSVDIGVVEGNSTGPGDSMQLTDSGWVSNLSSTFGGVNTGQSFALVKVDPEEVAEDSPLVFSAATLNAITVSDIDVAGGNLTLSLVVANGNLTLANSSQLSTVAGNGTSSLSVSGSVNSINTALDGMVYQPHLDFYGSDQLNIEVDDQANTGSGGSLTATASIEIEVTPINDIPSITQVESSALTYVENDGAVVISKTIEVDDVDSGFLQGAVVKISGNYQPSEDALLYSGASSISAVWDSVTGELTLSGSATVDDYKTALRSVSYMNASESPATVVRQVSFTVTDGVADSSTVTREVSVVPVNDKPVLGAVPSSTLSYVEDQTPVFIAPDMILSDLDHSTIQTATFLISLGFLPDEDLLSYVNVGGISATWNGVTGELTLSGSGTLSNWQDALRSVTYENTSQNPAPGALDVEIRVNDGVEDSLSVVREVEVTAINDDPYIIGSLPAELTLLEDSEALVDLSSITLHDPDSAGSDLVLTITALNGELNGSQTVVVQDTLAELNVWLANTGALLYKGAADLNGSAVDSIEIKVNDSVGNADIVLGVISVNIDPVNDRPLSSDNSVSTVEDQAYVFSISDFGFSDPIDNNALSTVVVQSAPSDGMLFKDSVQVSVGDSIAAADIASGLFVFVPDQNVSGSTQFDYQVMDDGGTVNGGENLSVLHSLSIDIDPVNDPPTGADKTVTIYEDSTYTFSSSDFGFLDQADNHFLKDLSIDSISGGGSLTLDGVPVFIGQRVTAADLANGLLMYSPVAHENGNSYASFQFTVSDDGNVLNAGQTTAISNNAITIDVLSVNDAPTGTDGQIFTTEDTDYTLTILDFGFSDSVDGNEFQSVGIVSLSGNGSLLLAGSEITSYTVVSMSDILAGGLVYRPAADVFGASIDTLQFQVRDNGATGNGGQDTDPTLRSLIVNVSAVNDPPAGTSSTITAFEDIPYVLTISDFGFTDVVEQHEFLEVLIDKVPDTGVLSLSGVGLSDGAVVAVAEILADNLSFASPSNAHGSGLTDLTFRVRDSGGTVDGGIDTSPVQESVVFNVVSINDPPSGTNGRVSAIEDTEYVFAATDFGYTDTAEGDLLDSVVISRLPLSGTLTGGAGQLAAGDAVTSAEILAGLFRFNPESHANGTSYTDFDFQVVDNGGLIDGGVNMDQSANTLIIDVAAVNDSPLAAGSTVSLEMGSIHTLVKSDFGFSDPHDGHVLNSVEFLAIPDAGFLELDGVGVDPGQSISISQIDAGTLIYVAPVGLTVGLQDQLEFRVQDDGGTTNAGTDFSSAGNYIDFNVSTVNLPPDGTDGTITTYEDTRYTFTVGDFGFVDSGNIDQFKALKISSLPANGELALAGLPLNIGDTVDVVQLDSGEMTFTPLPDAYGLPYSNIRFQVQDNGGTQGGGVDTDPLPNQLEINVLPVNDSPAGKDFGIAVLEDNSYIFNISDFGFTDTDANNFELLRIGSLPVKGVLILDNSAVDISHQVLVTDIQAGLLKYQPENNAQGEGLDWFDFYVVDDGGSDNGGVNTDAIARTVTVDVVGVNDPPSGTDTTKEVREDTAALLGLTDFGFTDPLDGDRFYAVRIASTPINGTLMHSGNPLSAGSIVNSFDLNAGLLTYVPFENVNGIGVDFIQFQVQDNGGVANGGVDLDQTLNELTIDILAVNDAPVGLDRTIDIAENENHVFSEADFGFSDPVDGDLFSGVTIESVPTEGELLLGGQAIVAGEFVTVDNIAASDLVYFPNTISTGAYLGLGFSVHDTGGTMPGIDADPVTRFVSFNLESVNDSPQLQLSGATLDEGSTLLIDTGVFNAIDPDNNASELRFTLTEVPQYGLLTLRGGELQTGDQFTLSEIISDQVTYINDGSEASLDYFSVSLTDGIAEAASGRFVMNITEVLDPAPLIEGDNISVDYGSAFDSSRGDLLSSGFASVLDNDSMVQGAFEIELESLPLHGNVVLNSDGTFHYEHDGSTIYSDAFSYRVTNEDGVYSIATVQIVIEPPQAEALPDPDPVSAPAPVSVVPPKTFTPVVPDDLQPELFTALVIPPVAEESSEILKEEVIVEEVQAEPTVNPEFYSVAPDNLEGELKEAAVEEVVNNTGVLNTEKTLDLLDELEIVQHRRVAQVGFDPQLVEVSGLNFEIVFDVPVVRSEDIIANSKFLDALNQLDSDFADAESESSRKYQLGADSAMGISLSLTAGALTWVLRGGSLLASVMAATPLWSSLDPTRIVNASAAGPVSKTLEEDSAVERVFDD